MTPERLAEIKKEWEEWDDGIGTDVHELVTEVERLREQETAIKEIIKEVGPGTMHHEEAAFGFWKIEDLIP